MVKDSDKKAGALGAEKTGGTLSGLLAEENSFDRRTLWRIGWWAAAALCAVVVAVLANQAALGWRRDRVSAADMARQTQLIQSLARDSQSEQRQLASAIETLNNDRDRLYARVTVLEQSLDSVTGALAKQSSGPAAAPTLGKTSQAVVASAEPQPAASSSPGQAALPASAATSGPTVANVIGAPTVAPVASGAPVVSEPLRAEGGKPGAGSVQAAHAQMPAGSSPGSSQPGSNVPTTSAAASLFAARSTPAPSDSAAGKPTAPDKLANVEPAPAADAENTKPTDAADTNAGATPVQKTEFAVDLGTANSLNGLRALWRGLSKSHKELAALRPIIIVKEGNSGLGMQLRLGAGPLADAAAAARICANLAESQRACETTVYDGQRLAIRSDDANQPDAPKPAAASAATKPAYQQRRRVAPPPPPQQHHGAAREEPPPPAPPPPAAAPPPAESSTLSSFFRRS